MSSSAARRIFSFVLFCIGKTTKEGYDVAAKSGQFIDGEAKRVSSSEENLRNNWD